MMTATKVIINGVFAEAITDQNFFITMYDWDKSLGCFMEYCRFREKFFFVKIWCKFALASEYINFIRSIELDRKRRLVQVHLLLYYATQICFKAIVENTLSNISVFLQVSLSKSVLKCSPC